MLEIIVALGLVSVVALAIIGVFSKLMTSSSKGADQAAAELLAQAVLDKATRSGPPGWGGLEASVDLETADASSDTKFIYRVNPDEIPGSEHALGSLYRVEVTVSWGQTIAPESQLDRGKLWVTRSRLTYVEGATTP